MSMPPPPPPPAQPAPAEPAPVSTPRSPRAGSELVTTVAVALGIIAALILAAVLAADLGDDDSGDDRVDGAPATLVRVDDTSLVVLDTDGEVVRQIAVRRGAPPQPWGPGRAVSLETAEDGVVQVIDLTTGEVDEIDSGVEGLVTPIGEDVAVVSSLQGGPAAIIDVAKGTSELVSSRFELADDPPLLLRNPSGREVAVLTAITNEDGDRSVVVPGDGGEAWLIEGIVVDATPEGALVLAGDRDAPTVRIERDGETRSEEVSLGERRVVGGVLVADDAGLLLLEDAILLRYESGSSELTELGRLDVGELRRGVPLAADRLLVEGDRATVLVDADGEVLRRWEPVADEPIALGRTGRECAVVQPGAAPMSSGEGIELIDVRTGESIVGLSASVELMTPDGCTVTTVDSPQTLVIEREVVALDADVERAVAVDPESRRIVVVRQPSGGGDAVFELREVDGDDVVELDRGGYRFYP